MEVTLSALSKIYTVHKSPDYRKSGIITLFSTSEKGYRFPNKIVGIIQKRGKSYRSVYGDFPATRTMHILQTHLKEAEKLYSNKYEYSYAKKYCAKGLYILFRLQDYMKSLGFQQVKAQDELRFVKQTNLTNQNEKVIMSICGVGAGSSFSENVEITLSKGDLTEKNTDSIKLECQNVFTQIQSSINSILTPSLLISVGDNISTLDKIFDLSNINNIQEESSRFVKHGFIQTTNEYKDKLINYLEATLEALKSPTEVFSDSNESIELSH